VNRPIRRVAIACLLMVLALLLADNVVQVVAADNLKKRPENGRQIAARLSRERGPIVVDGKAIAESRAVNDVYKYQRVYPGGSLYSAATGYYTLHTATGIEKAEDPVLSGDDGRLLVRRVSDLLTNREAKGGAVVLTLSEAAQQAAASALGTRRGAVVALDPTTGAILALVTSPSYDPTSLASHDGKAASLAFSILNKASDAPLLDRATQATYPPGSTFKVITAAAALANGATPDTVIDAPTSFRLPQSTSTLNNFGGEVCSPTGKQSLTDALTISCNTAFAKLGVGLGGDKLRRQAEAFGINSTVKGFPLPEATSVFPAALDAPQTALSAIGQFEVRVTPLQMAMVAGAVANRGREMKPYLVRQTLAPDLTPLGTTTPQELGRPIDGNVASELTQMMQSVVQRGTGTAAQIPGVAVAGKTGTAQHAQGQPPHAWFIGFAPADQPRVAVAVVVEDGGGELAATGGAVAAPIAQAVMQAALGGG